MKIATALEKIDEHQLFVPAFQREYVWKRDDAKQLVDSLIKEYPTGTMLTWETANPPELKGTHKYNQKQGAVRILLETGSSVLPRSICSCVARYRPIIPPPKF